MWHSYDQFSNLLIALVLQDIAFKIVNREWEYSWKHGFKSQFNNNIMQLWFRFKRNRYRR